MKAICRKMLDRRGLVMFVLAGLLLPGAVVAQNYRIIDLGTLGGSASAANALADNDTVVGWSQTASGQRHAFSSCPSCVMRDLGLLPGGSNSSATAISRSGSYIVGYSGINEFGIPFEPITQGFILSNDTMLSVGALYCPCTFNTRYGFSEALAVNDLGETVGRSETVRGRQIEHAFLWKDGVLQDIGHGAGDLSISSAHAINNASQVAGDVTESIPEASRRAFLWQNGRRQDIGVLPGHSSSSAQSLNDEGMVVGWSGKLDGSSLTAFLWHNGNLQDLGVLPGDNSSRALSINNAGQVVGVSGTNLSLTLSLTATGPDQSSEPDSLTRFDTPAQADQLRMRPFVWQNGSMLDLNSLLLPANADWVIIEARDINNRGWIAGTGLREGRTHAILLEPVTPERQ